MDEKQAYFRVAERSIEASSELVIKNHQESSAFFSYHAFESLGGAVCSHVNVVYSMSQSSRGLFHFTKHNMIRQPSGARDNTYMVNRALSSISPPMHFETANVIPYLTKNTTVQCPTWPQLLRTSLDFARR